MEPCPGFIASTITGETADRCGKTSKESDAAGYRGGSSGEARRSEPITYVPNDPALNILCLDTALPSNGSTMHGTPDAAEHEPFLPLEGLISRESVQQSLARRKRGGGDTIPWLFSQQVSTLLWSMGPEFSNSSLTFTKASFDHPTKELPMSMSKFCVTDEEIENSTPQTDNIKIRGRKSLPPVLLRMSEKRPDAQRYIGFSGKKPKFAPVYLQRMVPELIGEHSRVMIKTMASKNNDWLGGLQQPESLKMPGQCFQVRRILVSAFQLFKVCQQYTNPIAALKRHNWVNTAHLSI
ncbi:unnamed protein product [Tuber melanosporum]|uniref:(Perigord truffle) hypothetical protein n=1 Tax=Tuber melanosporum (strain Mel28) TaxID=656061 RepID=D5GER9_TUBMM|nr:uncharacterized protein GSTUM_00001347001 [Tuber melanosporum]CAZ83012.1 unnamed protein product [Tuber melanosporum]